jgi:hypothetical protein
MLGKFLIFVSLIIIGCTPALQEDQVKGDAQKTSAAAKATLAETAIVLGVRKEPVPTPPSGPHQSLSLRNLTMSLWVHFSFT